MRRTPYAAIGAAADTLYCFRRLVVIPSHSSNIIARVHFSSSTENSINRLRQCLDNVLPLTHILFILSTSLRRQFPCKTDLFSFSFFILFLHSIFRTFISGIHCVIAKQQSYIILHFLKILHGSCIRCSVPV